MLGRGGHSDDLRGGTGRGGGGRYQSAAGGDRRVLKRKAIDFNVPIMKQQAERVFIRDHRDRPTLEPTADSIRLLPACIDDVSHNPALGICTKYISLAVNKLRAPITALSWAPDGRKCVTGAHTGEFTMWSETTPPVYLAAAASSSQFSHSPFSVRAFCACARNGSQFNFEGIVTQAHEDPIRAMTWSHNDLLMLTADEGGVVKYWQTTMNNVKAFKAHKEPVRDISFSPNDMHFVTCSDDQTASIWDLETSTEVVCLKGHGWDVKAARWHPTKGIIITGSKDQLIKVWDPRAGAGGMNHGRNEHCLADLHAHKSTVNRLAWSPLNPNWFLSGSRDNLVKVFDIRTMKEFQTNRAHKKEITALTWHPTNERLFGSGSHDGAIHQWFVGESESQAEITGAHDSAVYGLEWHPLGHLLVSASNDHTTRFWARNRPGDDMTDKYNVASLPAAQKALAVNTLVEAAKMNPSKYSRLPAALAEFAQQGQQELQEATAKTAYGEANASTEFIPGMGSAMGISVPGMGSSANMSFLPGMGGAPAVKRESSIYSSNTAPSESISIKMESRPNDYAANNSSRSNNSSRDRRRSRSREREYDQHGSSSSSRPTSAAPSNSRYPPPSQPQSQSHGHTSAPPSGYNAFFPAPPPTSQPQHHVPSNQQQQHAAFFPPPPPSNQPTQHQPHYQQQHQQQQQHQPQQHRPAYPAQPVSFAPPPHQQQSYPPQGGFPPPPQQQPQQGYAMPPNQSYPQPGGYSQQPQRSGQHAPYPQQNQHMPQQQQQRYPPQQHQQYQR